MRPLSLLLFLFSLTASAGNKAEHVILISIDGFRPDFYRDADWPAPNLQHMAENGVSADGVRGIFPSVTYPSHTTMITGAYPRRHGIFYNAPFEPGGSTGAWYWFASSITAKTLWQAAKDKNLITAAISWPVSVGAPVDYNIPEIWPLDDTDAFELLARHVTPKGFLEELAQEAVGTLSNTTFNTYSLARDIRIALTASHLIRTYKPGLMTVHLVRTDFAQHDQGRDGVYVRRAVANADVSVGLIQEAVTAAGIADKTAFIITGDHGFVNVNSRLAPNVWLTRAGLRGPERDYGDWKAVFHKTGASAFLILKDPKDTATVDQVRRIINELPDTRRKLFRVLERADLERIGAVDVPLALTPVQGIDFSGSAQGDDLTHGGRGGTHGHLPDFQEIMTGFIGFGAGFEKGIEVKQIDLVDIAPMAIHLLGLEMATPDGTLYPGFFKRE